MAVSCGYHENHCMDWVEKPFLHAQVSVSMPLPKESDTLIMKVKTPKFVVYYTLINEIFVGWFAPFCLCPFEEPDFIAVDEFRYFVYLNLKGTLSKKTQNGLKIKM